MVEKWKNERFRYFLFVWVWMGVGRPCPPVRNDIVTPRRLFSVPRRFKMGRGEEEMEGSHLKDGISDFSHSFLAISPETSVAIS